MNDCALCEAPREKNMSEPQTQALAHEGDVALPGGVEHKKHIFRDR